MVKEGRSILENGPWQGPHGHNVTGIVALPYAQLHTLAKTSTFLILETGHVRFSMAKGTLQL